MAWAVVFCEEFEEEFARLSAGLQDELLAHLLLLEHRGPHLGRPKVDTLKGSRLANLKELRFSHARQPYRFLFAFDPTRQAVVLVGGCKAGDKRFYERLIPVAEARYERHLAQAERLERKKGT